MRALDFPNNIQIETTSRCNAKCGFCPYPETSLTQPQGTMDEDLFRSIVEQISRHPVQLIQPFLNNDPLMDRNIVPRLELLLEKNPRARVCVTTNGALLREETARALAGMRLDTIHISSNGLTRATYRRTMGIDGYTVLLNVNRLWDEMRRRGSKTKLVVSAILLSENREEVAHMREYWQSRGVGFYLNPLNDRAGTLGAEKFVQLLPFQGEAASSQLRRYDMSGCPSLYSFMGILWNGDLITCCMDWHRARVLGNARNAPLQELWRGAPYETLRRQSDEGRLGEVPLCRECGENRFSIDPAALRDLLERRPEEGPEPDLAVVAMLERLRTQQPGVLQLGLVRQ